MTSWRSNPLIYEINTWIWLQELSDKYSQPITLGTVPDAELDALAQWGLDALWLMGVWERSPAGRHIAQEHPGLQVEYRHALPDFTPEDVVGSPYSVRRYEVDAHLGGRKELAIIRRKLAQRGLRLILDFVPNHVAPDHPWIESHPECFIQGTREEMDDQPDSFLMGSGPSHHLVFANGRDPYFPPWTDTVQLNAFSPVLRAKAVDTLLDIASQCDGVRCDMAMLVTNRVFWHTWGERAGDVPKTEYWHVVIPTIKAEHPDFMFMGEVYWDMEWELQQQGFDYTYDKRLYDRLKNDTVRGIIGHLQASLDYQSHLVRLIENHDEGRAVTELGRERSLAGAVLITTLPGATLLHEGQFVGHRVKIPVQLGRRPPEPDDDEIEQFYRCILAEVNHPIYHDGIWRLHEVAPAWDLNATYRNLIAYTWRSDSERRLIVINFSSGSAQGRVALSDLALEGQNWQLYDVLNNSGYERDGDDIAEHGLYIDLKPWQAHLFIFR